MAGGSVCKSCGSLLPLPDGDGNVSCLSCGRTERVPAAALFAFIGAAPRTDWLAGTLASDEQGYLATGPQLEGRDGAWDLPRAPFLLETSQPGVFAAGDVRQRSVKRIASAVGEGAMAVQFVHQHLAEG